LNGRALKKRVKGPKKKKKLRKDLLGIEEDSQKPEGVTVATRELCYLSIRKKG